MQDFSELFIVFLWQFRFVWSNGMTTLIRQFERITDQFELWLASRGKEKVKARQGRQNNQLWQDRAEGLLEERNKKLQNRDKSQYDINRNNLCRHKNSTKTRTRRQNWLSAKRESFITYGKSDFINNPACRLINPSESEIGTVGQKILDNISKAVVQATKVKLWKRKRHGLVEGIT